VWWTTPITAALRRLRQDCEFENSLTYCLKTLTKKKKKRKKRENKVVVSPFLNWVV
jgi:hypothetical protein